MLRMQEFYTILSSESHWPRQDLLPHILKIFPLIPNSTDNTDLDQMINFVVQCIKS